MILPSRKADESDSGRIILFGLANCLPEKHEEAKNIIASSTDNLIILFIENNISLKFRVSGFCTLPIPLRRDWYCLYESIHFLLLFPPKRDFLTSFVNFCSRLSGISSLRSSTFVFCLSPSIVYSLTSTLPLPVPLILLNALPMQLIMSDAIIDSKHDSSAAISPARP